MNTTDTPTTRPLAERLSPGPYTFRNATNPHIFTTDHRWLVQTGNGAMDLVGPPCMEETGSNAELLCEALTVTHETGKTPRQLIDVLDAAWLKIADLVAVKHELVEALKDCAESLQRLPDTPDAYRVTCLSQARELLTRLQS